MKFFKFSQKNQEEEDVLFGPVYDPDKPKGLKVNPSGKPWKNPGGPAPATSRDFRQSNRRSLNFIGGSLGSMNIFS
tara:strand:- start:116 stop:343 length:228 start_codon:yes stop_codon:yes gene_type:complete